MLPDVERYRHHLDGMSLTEAQKSELIQTLWSMLESFVDRSFEGDQAVSLNYGEDTEHGGELISSGLILPTTSQVSGIDVQRNQKR